MTDGGAAAGGIIIPTMRYRDAPAAIEWLCRAFGFERHMVVPDESGGIAHAELRFGNGMIMLGSMREGPFGELTTHPEATQGRETQSPYIVVADVDAHYARARGAGAAIALEIKDEDHGGRSYSCHDPEGHLWNFGSYDPWRS